MGNVDSVPVISQLKSLGQVIVGDVDDARETQENFADNCPIVSQAKSLVQVCAGDAEGARQTQLKFVKDVEKFGAVAAGVTTAVVGVAITPFTGPIGTSLVGAGASGVVSTYATANEESMNWEKFGEETSKGALSGFCPVVGDVAAQVLDNHCKDRPLDENLGTAAVVGAVTWGVAAGVGAAGKAAAKGLKEPLKSGGKEVIKDTAKTAGKEVLKDTAKETASRATKETITRGGKDVLKDTVASRMTKAAVPLMKGSATNASAQLTSNICQGKTWHEGLGTAAASGAASSGVGAAVGKAGRFYGGSQKGVPKSERRSKTKTERTVLATAAVAKGGAASGAGKMTSNVCENKPIMEDFGDTLALGAVNGGIAAGYRRTGKCVSDTCPREKKGKAERFGEIAQTYPGRYELYKESEKLPAEELPAEDLEKLPTDDSEKLPERTQEVYEESDTDST